MIATCVWCKNEFTHNSKSRKALYCPGGKCKRYARTPPRNCEICHKNLVGTPKLRFCSDNCKSLFRQRKHPSNGLCKNCGQPVKPGHVYCTRNCVYNSRVMTQTGNCARCNKPTFKHMKYCNLECYRTYLLETNGPPIVNKYIMEARDEELTLERFEALSRDGSKSVKQRILSNHSCPLEIIQRLCSDPSVTVADKAQRVLKERAPRSVYLSTPKNFEQGQIG